MGLSLLRTLAVSGALAFVAATSPANAQQAFTSQTQPGGGDLSVGQTRIWAFNVPAGNYLAFGRVSYRLQSGQDSGGLVCQLKPMNTDEFWDYEDTSITGHEQSNHTVEGSLSLMSQVPVAAPGGQLVVQCRGTGGQTGTRNIYNVRLELITVRGLNTLSRVDLTNPRAPDNPRDGRLGRQN